MGLLALPSASSSDFIWATGIEDTFIVAPHAKTGRVLDEYLLTEHYERWEEDLSLIGDLGVPAARYGIPWYRVCPSPGHYDWSWTDKVLSRMVHTHKIEPIVDLVHYGTPPWMENSFLNPDYPHYVAEYAHAFATHYNDLCCWYTPLNEPRVNAWYSGRLGWWPPYGRSWIKFIEVLLQLSRGICLTQMAIADATPNAIFVAVDASDIYEASSPSNEVLVNEAKFRSDVVFLSLDLTIGKVDSNHPLYPWLLTHGVSLSALEWFHTNRVIPHIIGYNMYPMFSRKVVSFTKHGTIAVRIRRSWTETLVEIGWHYASRYGLPIMVTETAAWGSTEKRVLWIQESTNALLQAKKNGLPIVGYTFWPLLSLVAWAYQKGKKPLDDYIIHMGLYDLTRDSTGLTRRRTPAVDAFRAVVKASTSYPH